MNAKTTCPTFSTLVAACRWADGMQHRGRPCRGVVFRCEQVGAFTVARFMVARMGQVNALVAAGFEVVRH
jgi:hypothetical protein